MSTSILPDDSVVVRMPDRTVHVDPKDLLVKIRATQPGKVLGGSIVEAYDFSQIRRLRIVPRAEGGVRLGLELKAGRTLHLGSAPSSDVAMLTGRAVADICRCKLDAGQGVTVLAGPSVVFTEQATFSQPPRSSAVVPLVRSATPPTNPPTTPPKVDQALFGALFRESQMAAAVDPTLRPAVPQSRPQEDQKQTLIGIPAVMDGSLS